MSQSQCFLLGADSPRGAESTIAALSKPNPSPSVAHHRKGAAGPRARRAMFARVVLCGLSVTLASIASTEAQERMGTHGADPLEPAQGAEAIQKYKQMSLEELMALQITSVSRRPEELSATPSSIQLITANDIRRSGAISIPETLRLASNLAVAQRDSHQWAISARGFNSNTSNKLLVRIDGRSVYTPLFAGVFWDVQDVMLADVDRIEVISGPGATMWGSNAVNGVINITTKPAWETQGVLVSGETGTERRGLAAVRYGGSLSPSASFRVYGRYRDLDSATLPGGADAGDDSTFAQGGFRVDWNAAADDTVTMQGDIYRGRFDEPDTPGLKANGGNLLGRWSRILSEDSDVRLQLYYDRTFRNIPDSIVDELDTIDLDFQHRLPLGHQHDFVWGAGYRSMSNTVTNPPTLAFLPPKVTRERYSAFVQDTLSLSDDRMQITIGSKVEHNDYEGLELQPSGRIAWVLSETHLAWAAVSRAVRTPSRVDRELYAPRDPPFSLLEGNPGFRSEKLIAYEAGLRTQIGPRVFASLASYYNDYNDIRSVELLDPPNAFPITVGNGLTGHAYGVEVTVDYRLTDAWRLSGGYSRLAIDLRPKPGSTAMSGASSESNDAGHKFILRSVLDLPGGWELDGALRAVGAIRTQAVPAYEELDVRLAWHPTDNLELALVGRNLLHDHHAEFGAAASRVQIDRNLSARATWTY